jgi:hypothetical protein
MQPLTMSNTRLFRPAILIATVVLLFSLTTSLQAKPKPTGAASVLHEAFTTLAQADHDYDGHRVDAMKQIHLALETLSGKTKVKTHASTARATQVKPAAHKASRKEPESQAASDAKLRAAEGLLQQVSGEVSGVVLQHVQAALAQLNTALSVR